MGLRLPSTAERTETGAGLTDLHRFLLLCPLFLMGLFTAGRGPRGYEYEPRHYDSSDDDDIKRRMRSGRRDRRRRPTDLLYLAGLLALSLFIYFSL